jgi:DNA polymerase II small subunit
MIMVQKDILKFCLEKGLLVDTEVLNLFNDVQDLDSVKLIMEKIKSDTNQNMITRNVLEKNKENVNRFIVGLPEEKQKVLEKFKIKLGLSIEIEAEVSSVKKKEEVIEKSIVRISPETKYDYHKIEVKDFLKYFRNRFESMRNILQEHSELEGLVSINKLSGNSSGVSIIGIVTSKQITKNKNMILEVEDLTGKIKVLINKNKPELFEKAEDIALDSVLGFNGSGNSEIFFVNDFILPEAMLPERKRALNKESALFIGDLHFGSKNFLEKGFMKFVNWLNNSEDALSVKYLFMVGDVVTGVGNYPDQEPDLKIVDLEEQFIALAKILGGIRKDIKIIISPGNHDCVRIMEPQPIFDEKYSWALHDLDNVILTENPCNVNIASCAGFSGFDVLTYHGYSYFYYAGNISSLIKKNAKNCPIEIMKFLLKNRHLAPTHTSTQYFPLEKDPLIIRKIPDIFVSAHTHKCEIGYYNNILVISTSCWEAMTPYQEKFGNVPDHCKVPMIDLKTREVKILDFETEEEGEDE